MSRRPRPIVYIRVENHLVPQPRFMKLFDEQIAVGEEISLDRVLGRSLASHNHYFAALQEGFDNLAEEYAQEFVSVEHMRAWCLCKEGYCSTSTFALATAGDARKLRDQLKRDNDCAIIGVSDSIATIYTPFSQSMAAMGREQFEESKASVLARVAAMARTTPAELKKNAGRSA